MHPEFDYGRMIGGIIRECLGGFAACGLLRKNFPNHPPFPDKSEYQRLPGYYL
jgi:hypothetical protein